MMSIYGFGAGEAIRLELQDIDWHAGTLKIQRPKTGVVFLLPLLPARHPDNLRPSTTGIQYIAGDINLKMLSMGRSSGSVPQQSGQSARYWPWGT
jgi:integrase